VSRNWTLEELAATRVGAQLRSPAPTSFASRDGATAGHHALAAAPAVNVASDRGSHSLSDDASAPRLSPRALANLQPEQRLQIGIVSHWRPLLVPGAKLLGVNGELPNGGKLGALRQMIRTAMGYTRGTADLLARRRGYMLWLEVKVPGNFPSEHQGQFAGWAIDDCGDGYCVVTTVEDAGAALKAWGMVA
jgi:hypothetical protein